MKLNEIASKLKSDILSKRVKTALIFSHHRPDGDTVGSATSLALALEKLGVKTKIVCHNELPSKFLFLKGIEKYHLPHQITEKFDVYISVDCSVEYMFGSAYSLFEKALYTINIDHHISNSRYAKYNFVEEVGACCEHLYDFIKYLGVEIDENIANSLLLGIVTDTGNFGHSNCRSVTLKSAYELVSLGANLQEIIRQMYKNQSIQRAKLYTMVISNMRYLLDGKLLVVITTQKDLKETGADESMTEGFIDFPLSIDTCEVALSILQTNQNTYKISFRSKGKVNVNEIASIYGGGGHILASGALLNGHIEDIIDKLSYNVKQRL